MPSHDWRSDDYECRQCYNNSILCGCEDWSSLEKEVIASYKKRNVLSFPSRSHKAVAGKMTATEKDGKIVFARWEYIPEGRFVEDKIEGIEHARCVALLNRYLLHTTGMAAKV